MLQLGPGQFLLSPDTYFKLTMRRDGDLVVSPPNGQPLWRSHTRPPRRPRRHAGRRELHHSRGAGLAAVGDCYRGQSRRGPRAQDDGNLLVYSESGQILWQSKTRNAGLRERTRGTGQDGEPRTGILASTRGVRRRRNGCTDSIGTGLRARNRQIRSASTIRATSTPAPSALLGGGSAGERRSPSQLGLGDGGWDPTRISP